MRSKNSMRYVALNCASVHLHHRENYYTGFVGHVPLYAPYRSARDQMVFLSVRDIFLGLVSGSLKGSPLTLACFLACLSFSVDAINYTK